MKAINIFKDKKFIECLKKRQPYDNDYNKIKFFNYNKIKIINEEDEIIEENINKVIKINCYEYWITNIEGIHIFKNLRIARLYDNKIKEIPKEIEQLKNLKHLYLYNNEIKEIPKEIGELKNLERLYLSHNQIQKIPKEIGKLKNLEVLFLPNNQIKELPNEIWNLKKIKKLNLNKNQLQYLPEEILKLNKLRRIWLYEAFDLDNLKQDPKKLLNILKELEKKKTKGKKNILTPESLKYLKEEVYPVLVEKIKEKYWITDLKQIKDDLNLDNLNF